MEKEKIKLLENIRIELDYLYDKINNSRMYDMSDYQVKNDNIDNFLNDILKIRGIIFDIIFMENN